MKKNKNNNNNNNKKRQQYRGESDPNPESVIGIRIPTSGSGWLPKFSENVFVQRYIYGNFFTKIRSVSPDIWTKLWKNALSRNVKKSF